MAESNSDTRDIRYWKLLGLVANEGENGILKTEIDKQAESFASTNTVSKYLDILDDDGLVFYPPKHPGWRSGQAGRCRMTEKGVRSLRMHLLSTDIVETMPKQLKIMEISDAEAEQAFKRSIMTLPITSLPTHQRLSLKLSRREREKLMFFREAYADKEAKKAAKTHKIVLAYPPDEPIEFPGRQKELFIDSCYTVIAHICWKETLAGFDLRKTPCRVLIDHRPLTDSENLRGLEGPLFLKWMKQFHPEIRFTENQAEWVIHYPEMRHGVGSQVQDAHKTDVSTDVNRRDDVTKDFTERMKKIFEEFHTGYCNYYFK